MLYEDEDTKTHKSVREIQARVVASEGALVSRLISCFLIFQTEGTTQQLSRQKSGQAVTEILAPRTNF